MKRPPSPIWQFLNYLGSIMVVSLLCAGLLGAALTHAVGESAVLPAWATPDAMALRRVSDIPNGQHEPTLLNNTDCVALTYYPAGDGSLHTGCFTPTAFGLLDSDTDTVLFAGSNRGLSLLPYSAHEVLVPWSNSFALIALDAAITEGSYISLYENPLASVHNQPGVGGQMVAKQLSRPPDLTLKDPNGKPLVINPQTMAFSEDGSWLVVETLGGAFVRINLASLDMMAFAPAFGSQGSPGLLKSQVAVSSDGHYVAIANKEAGSLKIYDLTKCGPATVGLLPQDCAAYDYQPFITQKVAGFQDLKHLRFVNDGLLSFEVQASNSASSGVYELAPTGSITSLIDYLALGDSYTSGEGAFDYLTGTDTTDDRCHLSVHAYPLLLRQDLFSGAGGHSVACSGAEINDVGSTNPSYRGQVRGVGSLQQLQQSQAALLGSVMSDYSPGYVAQQRFLQQYQPGITTVSVGGNDIGFGDILQRCVTPHISIHPSDNTCFSTYEDRLEVTNLIDRTVPRWIALYKQLLHEAPGTTLYAIGYPQIVDGQGNCALNVHLDTAELEFSEELTDYLNSAIKQAADAAGVRYIDISQALVGHRLCEAASYDVAVNGLTAGTDSGPIGLRIFGQESYHPNALGHALIEQAILRQTNNFASFTAAAAGSSKAQSLLNAPKTGRPINTLVPDDTLTSGVIHRGKSVSLQVHGTQDGLAPNTGYSIRLDGLDGLIVGSVTSDGQGNAATYIVLPDSTAAGEHTIDITGSNQAGEAVDVTQPVYVPVRDNDTDGDGIPDTLDTCPGAVNSGQDDDRDGIDDACDSFIGSALPPSGGPTNSGNSTDSGSQPPVASNASFTPTTGQSAATFTASSSFQLANNEKQVEHLTGSSTVNPSSVPPKNLGVSTKHKAIKPHTSFAKLYTFNWLVWVVRLVIIWLAIMLGLCIKHVTDSSNRKVRAPSV